MIRNLIFLNLAELFERFTYYGVRSIFLLFLWTGLKWDQSESTLLYGYFIIAVHFASLFGGILSDATRKPVLIAIIGNSSTTLGIFLFAFADSPVTVYSACGLMALGAGLFKPSIISAIYRVSFHQKHRLDLIFTVFYCVINIGAFAAPFVIANIGDTGNPADLRLGFIIAGCFSIIPTVLLSVNYNNLIYNDLLYNSQTYKLSDIRTTNIVFWFILTLIFWMAYDQFSMFIDTSFGDNHSLIFTAVLGLVFYFALIPIHLIRNFRSALKISIGLLMVAIVCIVYPLLNLPPVAGLVMLSISEVLIIPVIWSQMAQNCSPRFTGTIMSLLMLGTWVINKASSALYDSEPDRPIILWILAVVCLGLMAGFLVLDYFQKKREQI